ncbi:hypothetical protein BKA67DRAFT_542274 [Truncatella angustata]|uniref:Uncharacterized protein n=1 Tax=Truncatella angustata TaxID=152316 RepID=A0A9P8RK41_9PEZI|nr:uncharacterized protein BKA67DRAFT_542274 [Truncatella angustata]KAH6643314.1 hypothetical protein BKA67DRAFT_542274 [Truncatella angustata]
MFTLLILAAATGVGLPLVISTRPISGIIGMSGLIGAVLLRLCGITTPMKCIDDVGEAWYDGGHGVYEPLLPKQVPFEQVRTLEPSYMALLASNVIFGQYKNKKVPQPVPEQPLPAEQLPEPIAPIS